MQPLCRVDEIADGGAREACIEGDECPIYLLLARRGDRVFAYFNTCPHVGRPLNWAPNRFLFTPLGQLVCSAHGATFEVDSGECVLGPCLGARLTRFDIEIRDNEVWPASQSGE